jgi:hypothetical protein
MIGMIFSRFTNAKWNLHESAAYCIPTQRNSHLTQQNDLQLAIANTEEMSGNRLRKGLDTRPWLRRLVSISNSSPSEIYTNCQERLNRRLTKVGGHCQW